MDRARPQGSGLDLFDSPAVTTASYQNRDIGMPLDGSRRLSKETSVDLGNGILSLETGRHLQPLNARKTQSLGRTPHFSPLRPTKPLKSRRFPQIRKLARFARTGWWWTQSCETGLRRPHSRVTGKKQGKSAKIGLDKQNLLPIIAVLSATCADNSLGARTGNSFVGEQGIVFAEQGLEWRLQRIYREASRQTSGGLQLGVTFVGIGLCCVEGEQGDRVAVALT